MNLRANNVRNIPSSEIPKFLNVIWDCIGFPIWMTVLVSLQWVLRPWLWLHDCMIHYGEVQYILPDFISSNELKLIQILTLLWSFRLFHRAKGNEMRIREFMGLVTMKYIWSHFEVILWTKSKSWAKNRYLSLLIYISQDQNPHKSFRDYYTTLQSLKAVCNDVYHAPTSEQQQQNQNALIIINETVYTSCQHQSTMTHCFWWTPSFYFWCFIFHLNKRGCSN